MAFLQSLKKMVVPAFRRRVPDLRKVSVSGSWTRCVRWLSEGPEEQNSKKFAFDEDIMNIINPDSDEADPRDIPVFLSDQPTTADDTTAPNDTSSYHHSEGSLPIVRMRPKGLWYQKLPIVHIKATYNNTIYTITDSKGQVLAWTSAGSVGFKNSRRGTTFASESAGITAAQKARSLGFQKVQVKIKGPGPGRQPSIKGLEGGGLEIVSIQDVTGVPHNGCRPRKARRL